MIRLRKPQRLMSKAILFVAALMVLPMLLISWYANERASLAIQQQTGKAFLELNRQNLATMDRLMDAVDQNLVAMLRTSLIQSWDGRAKRTSGERVGQYVETEKLLENYSGEVQYSFFALTQNPDDYDFAPYTDLSDSGVFLPEGQRTLPWLQQTLDKRGGSAMQIIDRFGYAQLPSLTLSYSRGVSDLTGGGRLIGVLVATDIDGALVKQMNAFALPQGANSTLTDAEGRVLSGRTAATGTQYRLPDDGQELLPRVRIAGDSMYVYQDSDAYGYRLIYDIPLASLVGSHQAVQSIILVSAACYVLIVLLVLFYFVRSVLRPMSQLARLARSFEPGRPIADEFAEQARSDEIGLLYRSFHAMTGRINQLIEERYGMELKQKESELMLMHSQITPHLLYNTLDSIYWYGIQGGVPEVAEMVRDLSTVLRIGLSRGKEMITVREELSHAVAYLQLQDKRYRHSFQYAIRADDETMDCMLPKVIIQPLVENAILHGVGKMEGEGEVEVLVRLDGGDLLIAVQDNGFRPVDLPKIEALLAGTAGADGGFGIRSVHRRVTLRFGSDYGLRYEARESGGTRAELRLPRLLKNGDGQPGGHGANR
ncbi:sensor histidine kinase [Cohnella sp. GCM10012308]|uniref:sensor histidine kinase n=1 Tax=Cohnella sp. GCM10012308 TaxID=3317329 RepID=UPI00361CCBC0